MKRLTSLPPHLASTLTYLGTVAVTQLASFVLLPIVTRFLGPDRFGEYAVALAFSNLLAMFGTSWIRNVAFRYYYDARLTSTTRSFYWSIAGLQAGVIAVVFGVAAVVMGTLTAPLVPVTTVLAAAVSMLVGDFAVFTIALLRAEQLTGRFAVSEVTGAFARLLGTILGLVAGLRSPEFLFLASAAASAGAGAVAVASLRRHLTGPRLLSRLALTQVTGKVLEAMPFSVGEWLNTLADRLILNYFTTRAVVGVYAAGHGVGDRVVGGVVMAVFMMAWPDVLRGWNEGGIEAAKLAVRRYLTIYLWLTVGPVIALVLYADTIVLLLGDGFQDAAKVIALVALAAWARGFGNCFNRHLELEKRFWMMSAMTLLGAAVNVVLNFWLVPVLFATGAALSALTTQVFVAACFVLIRNRQLVEFPFREAVLVVLTVGASSGAALVVFGSGMVSLVAFTLIYVLVAAAVWLRRMR